MDKLDPSHPAEAPVSIGRLAELTGISPDRLRVWERRYGRPRPIRLESGHRRYEHDEVLILRQVAELLAQGRPVGETLALDDAALKQRYLDCIGERRGFDGLEQWIDAVQKYDAERLHSSLCRELDTLDLIDFLDQRIGPLLTTIGSEWAQGSIEVRHEHFVSNLVERFLDQLLVQTPQGSGRSIVLSTFPNEEHSIGLKMLDLTARAIELHTIWIGPGTPIAEIRQSILETNSTLVGISLSASGGGPAAMRAVTELSAQLPENVQIIVGGAGVPPKARGNHRVHLFHSLRAFSDWMTTRESTPS
tara:strand:- start:4291 stop:5205 length:915 start_codon:yes stop_codon:yes gene_type:complete